MKLGELQRLVCKMDIVSLLEEFVDLIRNEEVEVYNEFSLQHELGIFLRAKLTENKVQFERNTKFFGITGTVKHEIDIVIYNENEKYAIELKYPLNGQYPEQMYRHQLCMVDAYIYGAEIQNRCIPSLKI